MENEPSLLDVADEEFAKINKPEQKQEQGSLLDIADDEFKQQEEESTQKEFDVAKLEKLKAEGKRLSEAQERMIFDEKDKVPLLEQTAIGLEKFIPAAAVKVGQLARGAYELAREGVVKPVYVGTKYHLGLATPKETNIAARGAEIAGRSAVSGVMSDLEDTAGTIIKGYESGSAFTDKLQGLSADERFKRYRWRETFSGYEQARREETPDRAAAILSENVLLQKAAGIAAKMQGGTEEEAKEAEKAYSELVLESGLTREELNPYISSLGEVISPISIPGANIATKGIGKYTGKAVQKGGELALKKLVKPVATGVEKSAEFVEKGITGVQTGARKLGEYVTGDPDTLIRGGSIAGLISAPQITGTILAAKPAAIATKEIARTFKDIASAVDVGGAAGRRGLVERGGAKPNAGALTKRLFSAESRGGLGRARAADWMIRQGNAITQQGVNGAVLNTILGLPDIESIEQGFEAAGSGFGIGSFTGSRIMERAGAVIDPRTGLAQKIDTIITPDPSSRRADEDADIKRFLSSVDPDLVPKMEKLGSIDERKKAIQSKVDALEKQKNVTFGPEVELIKKEIIRQKQNIEKLDKSTPQTQKEILRQIHLAFADEMDLAKTTGKAAGLNNIQVKILDPSEMEGFYRNSYGTTLTDAESVVASLTGKPDLTPEETQSLKNARTVVDGFFREVAGSQSTRGFAVSEGSDSDGNPLPEFMRKQNLQGATIVINGDLVKQLSDEGFNIRNVVGHEMQHALERFTEVRDMLAPIRKDLFDQKTIEPDGTVKKITSGIYSDDKLDSYADVYAASMSPSDGGKSFKEQFGDDKEKLRAYIKEEVLSELSGRSGNVNAGTRAALDSIGRQAVDWLEVKTQNGALKKIKETLRKSGIIFDDNGTVSTILGAELTPESLAMIRQYKRQLKNLNQSMVYETGTRKEEVDVPIERIMADRSLQEKTKDIDLFQKEQVAVVTAPDGSKQEIPIPPDTGVDSFVGKYNIQEGQLVDESGSPINLGPIEFGTVPNGTQVEIQSVISRDSDGVPKALTLRKAEQISRERGKTIKDALDSAMQKGALQMEDMGNGHYRGTMSEAQVSAILALPNTIVSPELKREILFVNEILRRRDGTRIRFEYFPTTKGGKPNSISMQIRDEIPIGFHFSKKFNFFKTTISVTRMMEKLNAWVAKNPENLKLWNGDTSSFWDDLTKVLANHASGERGEYQLDDDVSVAIEKKNAINDLFNVYNAETKAANPRRTKLPRQKGKDPLDIIVRSRRMDRIGQYIESDEQKLPFNYELNTRNYMPAENPLAGFQTPEDFASDIPSVTAEEIRGAINTGNLDQVEAKLRETDDLKPAESLDEENGNIRIVSMFDNQFMPEEPMESEPEVSASATQFMPAETERYPTSERGFYSGLQKTIDEKVQGKFASPEQLKAIVTNPQNAKAEELKWSGVLGEIDRLAEENQGKVPKDKVMDYLRNEGAVKFEEVTLGGATKTWTQSEIDALERQAQRTRNFDAYEQAVLEFEDQQLGSDANQTGNQTKYAQYQLPGGTNYREVVMTMPRQEKTLTEIEQELGYETGNLTFEQQNEVSRRWKQYTNESKDYTSSHFPETPNYVAHMRLNERTDAQGNDGLFVEELQSDRHQAGREEGYKDKEAEQKLEVAKEAKRNFVDNVIKPTYGTPPLATDSEYKHDAYRSKWSDEHSSEFNRLNDNVLIASDNVGGIPDAPFRKDWSIQLFKRALRDAVDSNKKWIGWTTGDTQAERYKLSKQVDSIVVILDGENTYALTAYKDGRSQVNEEKVPEAKLSEFIGKELANQAIGKIKSSEQPSLASAEFEGLDLDVGGEGMKGFYDQILPKEIGKYVGKMGGKVEKSEIGQEITEDDLDMGDLSDATPQELAELEATGKVVGNTVPIWRVDITPEMAGKVRGGQLQFMPAVGDYPSVGININSKTQDFTDQILRGEKTIETRPSNSLKSLIGKRVGIVRTGKGKATLVGYANIQEPIIYNNAEEFRADQDKHLVEAGSNFDIKPDQKKYGYPLTDVESIEPIEVPSNLPNWYSARSIPQTQFMPAEQPTEYEPISARIRPLQGISAPTKVVGAKALSLGEIEPPVRGKAMLPDMELKPDISEKGIQSSDITGLQFMPAEGEELQGTSIPEAILKGSGEFAILRQSLEGKKPSFQEKEKEQIPVAKTDTEEESSDSSLISTGVDVPESVDEQSNISNALTIANSQSWRKGRDFKLNIQNRVLDAAKKAGVQISERTAEAIEYLARVGLKDGLLALDQNPNAIGWYDEKTKQALGVMSLMFPEIATDQNARFAFTWALAVTSNGLKVDKNFELAERVYREFRKTGKMPTNLEAGQAQESINKGLDLFNKLTKDWGVENTRKFMQTDFTVGEISRLSKDLSPGGEFADTNVRGSAILGPKIGNGFFSNLYGMFDALTMDRWLVRTWGRWTGTLVEFNPELTELAKNRLQQTIDNLTPEDKARMDAMIKNDISQMGLEYLSLAIQKASMKPELRQLMNTTATGEEFRKAGNGYAKYMDGQKEAPSGPTERNFIREIFGLMLDELKSYPKYKDLTMADLQAVLWYAEKRLYETAKIKSDQDSLDSSDADGYEDDDAPDYANAAIGVARKKKVPESKIKKVLEKIKNDRTTTTRPEIIEGNQPESEQQKSAGGFVGKEKQKFKQYVAVTTARRNRVGNESVLWTYARRSGSDGSNAGVLKPKSKKNLGVKYISEWKPGRKLATMFRNNELPPVKFLELDSTDKASAQKFVDTLQQSKESSPHGASVYVYPAEDYQGMNLFLSDSGKSGFAVKPDGDIVSVFSMEKGSGRSIMEAAIAAGGKKLDAFDTILPRFYGEHGFIEAARIPWNDEFAPDGWDKQAFKKYNNGEPDVVMMVLDPKFEGEYEARTDVYTTEYDQAVKMQNSMLKKMEPKRK